MGVAIEPYTEPLDRTVAAYADAARTQRLTIRRQPRSVLRGELRGRALTPRESEVLADAIEGHSSKETALRLGIRNKTVTQHRTAILIKLGARTMVQAAALYIVACAKAETTAGVMY